MGPRRDRKMCQHGCGDAVQSLLLESSVEFVQRPRNMWGVHRHRRGDVVRVLPMRSSIEPPTGLRSMREARRNGREARLDLAGGASCGFPLFGHEAR